MGLSFYIRTFFGLKAKKFFCLGILHKDLVLNIKAESSSTTLACKAQNPETTALLAASPRAVVPQTPQHA